MVEFPRDVVDRYEPIRLLGRGSMGVVWEVKDRASGDRRALKLLLKRADPQAEQRFQHEARALQKISHPGVVKLHDHGVAQAGPYLVMELLDGLSLEELTPLEDPLAMMLPVAEALEAVHASNLVHRDLKPANIVRTRDGRSVITDFGMILFRDGTRLTDTGKVVGTPAFMALEVLQGGDITSAVDWWAYGLCLYQLAEGHSPYTLPQIIEMGRSGIVPEFRYKKFSSSSGLAGVVRACVYEDPADRPKSRADIEHLLAAPPPPRHTVTSTTKQTRPGRLLVAAPKPAPRDPKRQLAAGLAAMVSVVVLGGAAAWTLRGDAPVPPPLDGPDTPASNAPPPWPFEARLEIHGRSQLGVARREGWVNPDPAAWPEMLGDLAHCQRFFDWIAAGGQPEELEEEQQAALRALDVAHAELGLEAPFGVYLPPWDEGNGGLTAAFDYLPAGVDPAKSPGIWLRRAAAAYLAAAAAQDERRTRFKRGGLPPGLEVSGASPPQSFDKFTASLLRDANTRVSATSWMRPAATAARRMVIALGRSLRSEPATRVQATLLGRAWLESLRAVWRGAPATLDPKWLIGAADLADPAAAWHIRAVLMEHRARTVQLLGGETSPRDAKTWATARQRAESEGPLEAAFLRLVFDHAAVQGGPAPVTTYRKFQARIEALAEPLARLEIYGALLAAWRTPGTERPASAEINKLLAAIDDQEESWRSRPLLAKALGPLRQTYR